MQFGTADGWRHNKNFYNCELVVLFCTEEWFSNKDIACYRLLSSIYVGYINSGAVCGSLKAKA